MRRLADLRIGEWLGLGFGAAALLLVGVAAAALLMLGRIAAAERRVTEVVAPRAAAAGRVEQEVLRVAVAVRTLAIVPEERTRAEFDAARASLADASASLEALPSEPDERELRREVLERAGAFSRRTADFAAAAARPGEDLSDDDVALSAARKLALASLAELGALERRKSAEAIASIRRLQQRARAMIVTSLVFTLALLGATALLVRRAVRTPVRELVEAARRIGTGDHGPATALASPEGSPRPRGELAELKSAFGGMALAIQEREERIAGQNEELQAQNEELQAQGEELQAQNEELQAQREELEAQAEQLRDTDRQREDFLAVLSHELRNPLTTIANAVQLLKRVEGLPPDASRPIAVAERQARQLRRLVDDLLDATRFARGKVRLQRARVDVARVVREAAEDAAPELSARHVGLSVDAAGSRPIWVDADPARIAQVLGNLLHNAAKFTPAGGTVWVAVAESAGRAVIRVRDTGVGIAPEVLPRLFHPFVQSESSLARSRGGLGLGLALVKGLVEMHGGSVRAASDGEGKGAEFTIELPIDASAPVASPEDGARAPGQRRRMVLIEDNPESAEMLADLLRQEGHEVDVAPDGPTGLARVQSAPPDVVLCDLGLPGMDGYEVARAIRSNGAGAVVLVALTGYGRPEDVRRARAAGFDAHLTKPATPEDVAAVLARLFAARGVTAGG